MAHETHRPVVEGCSTKKSVGIGRVIESFELRAAPNDPFGSFLLLGGFGLAIPVASDFAEESVTAESTSEASPPHADAAGIDSFARRPMTAEGELHVGNSTRTTPAAYDEALGQVDAFFGSIHTNLDELSLGALLDAPLVDAFSTATPDPLPESDANEARSSLQSRASSGSGVTNSGSAAGVRGSAAASELGGAPSNGAPTNAVPETFASLSGQGTGGTPDSGSETGAAVNSGGSAGSDEAIQPTSGGNQSASSASPTNDSGSEFGVLSNNPPTAEDDTYSTQHDVTLTVAAPGVVGNDHDNIDFDPLTAVLDTGPSSGSFNYFNSDGSFEYVPDENFKGEDSFTYYAHDGIDFSQEVAKVTINVTNTAPAAMDDSYATTRNGTLTVAPADGVLNNDTDNVEFDPLTAELDTGPTNGSFNYFNSDGSFEYVPNLGFVGTDSFTYYANDGVENSLTPGTVTITITNTAPVAVNDTYHTIVNGTFVIGAPGALINDTDADGDSLTAVLDTSPTDGTLTTSGGTPLGPGDSFDGGFIYVPDTAFEGIDTFTYHATDGLLDSNVAAVTIKVSPYLVDIDVDSDNDGFVSSTDDPVEETAPGLIVFVNNDDDDGDFIPDRDDGGPITGENDLAPAQLSITTMPGVDLSGFQIRLEAASGGSLIKLWDSPAKDTFIPLGTTFTLGSGSPSAYFPGTVYIEGYDPGHVTIAMALLDGTATEVSRDTVAVVSAKVAIKQGATDITGTKHDEFVGSKISLSAVVTPAGLDVTDRSWTVPEKRVANWVVDPPPDPTSARVIPLTVLDAETVVFHWVDGANGRKVQHSLKVAGKAVTRDATFDVKRPHKSGDPTQPLRVQTQTHAIHIETPPGQIWLSFGRKFNDPWIHGIDFQFSPFDEDFGGSFQWVQLLEERLLFIHDDGDAELFSGAGLDTLYPYPPAGIYNKTNDTPQIKLEANFRVVEAEMHFQMFLMWRPATGEKIWVPLRRVDWFWEADVVSADGLTWSIVPGTANHSVNPADTDATEHPEWERNVATTPPIAIP